MSMFNNCSSFSNTWFEYGETCEKPVKNDLFCFSFALQNGSQI